MNFSVPCMEIRAETLDDRRVVRSIHVAAFGRSQEADLVDQLRGVASTFSFVAVESAQIIGHIFYSPVAIEGKCADHLFILGLAPVAVRPEHQRQGIGASLIRHSLAACTRLGCRVVVVLGNPAYYAKFGFMPAKNKGLTCEYTVPEDAFMVLELVEGALAGCSGTVKYRPEFRVFESRSPENPSVSVA
jgi:putative acetyltransferase